MTNPDALHMQRLGQIVLAAIDWPQTEQHVLMALLQILDHSGHADTTIAALAAKTGHGRNTVARIMHDWSFRGIIVETYDDGRRWTKGWQLMLPKYWEAPAEGAIHWPRPLSATITDDGAVSYHEGTNRYQSVTESVTSQ